jgi:hypothetical protein
MKWCTRIAFYAAAAMLFFLFMVSCSQKQPSVSDLALAMPVVIIQTATPAPTKAPLPTSAPEPVSNMEPSQDITDEANPPRYETLYFGGRQWGAVKQWNP